MNQFPQPAVRLPHAAEPQRVSPGTVTMPQTMDRVLVISSPKKSLVPRDVLGLRFDKHFWNRRAEGFNFNQPQLVRRNYDCDGTYSISTALVASGYKAKFKQQARLVIWSARRKAIHRLRTFNAELEVGIL